MCRGSYRGVPSTIQGWIMGPLSKGGHYPRVDLGATIRGWPLSKGGHYRIIVKSPFWEHCPRGNLQVFKSGGTQAHYERSGRRCGGSEVFQGAGGGSQEWWRGKSRMAFLTKTGFRMNSRSEGVSTENQERLCWCEAFEGWSMFEALRICRLLTAHGCSASLRGKEARKAKACDGQGQPLHNATRGPARYAKQPRYAQGAPATHK